MNKKKKNNKGFTLVELIVVISILAVLAATAVFAVGNISQQARDAAITADINVVVRALNTYNSLAGAPRTTLGPSVAEARAQLQDLTLSTTKPTDPDIVDLNLGVDVPDDRLEEVLAGISYVNGMWVAAPPSGGTL